MWREETEWILSNIWGYKEWEFFFKNDEINQATDLKNSTHLKQDKWMLTLSALS